MPSRPPQSAEELANEMRSRANEARSEAERRGSDFWGYTMLNQAAEYFEQRALELEEVQSPEEC
jgi:hypothetical protein